MKKVLATIAATATLLSLQGIAQAAKPAPVSINFNGNTLNVDVDPVIQNGRTLVPIRAISESLGADVKWEAATKTVTIVKHPNTLSIVINKKETQINDVPGAKLDVAAQLINGRTMVPVRFVAENLGATIDWNGQTRTVLITHDEKRENLSPAEMMAKVNGEMAKLDTYKMSGLVDLKMKLTDPTGEWGSEETKASISFEGVSKTTTQQVYMKSIFDFMGEKVSSAVYGDTEFVYTQDEDQAWVKTPKGAQEAALTDLASQDPSKALEMLKEIGLNVAYGNDEKVGDKEYYVLKATLDQQKFLKKYGDLAALGGGLPVEDGADLEGFLKQVKMNLSVKIYIDKQTYLIDAQKLEMSLRMADQELIMEMEVNGNFVISEFNQPVEFPVVPTGVKVI